MASRSIAMVVLILALLFVAGRPSSGSIAGNSNPSITFDGVLRGADGKEQFGFTIDVEPWMFRLLTVQNKYRLVRVRIQNSTPAPLALSADGDSLQLVPRSGASVPAVLNVQRGDGPLWDSLDASTRETLAYPVTLRGIPSSAGGLPRQSPEVLYFYAFFPAQVQEVPMGFTYKIASLSQTIRIERHAEAAR